MHRRGCGDFTFQLCWTSGDCIQRMENTPDSSLDQLTQYMDEGLIKALPRARTTREGEWLESYRLVYGTNVMKDGGVLSDYELQPHSRLTVILVDLSDEREHGAANQTTAGARTH